MVVVGETLVLPLHPTCPPPLLTVHELALVEETVSVDDCPGALAMVVGLALNVAVGAGPEPLPPPDDEPPQLVSTIVKTTSNPKDCAHLRKLVATKFSIKFLVATTAATPSPIIVTLTLRR